METYLNSENRITDFIWKHQLYRILPLRKFVGFVNFMDRLLQKAKYLKCLRFFT